MRHVTDAVSREPGFVAAQQAIGIVPALAIAFAFLILVLMWRPQGLLVRR